MQIQKFGSSLPMMLYKALDVVMPRFREIYREFGLTEKQWRILRVLWEHDEMSPREMADQVLIPPPSLVGVLNRLEKRNLVARRPNDDDRRGLLVRITDEGKKLRAQVIPRVDVVYSELRASIDPDIWNQLQTGLDCVCRAGEASRSHGTAVNE